MAGGVPFEVNPVNRPWDFIVGSISVGGFHDNNYEIVCLDVVFCFSDGHPALAFVAIKRINWMAPCGCSM